MANNQSENAVSLRAHEKTFENFVSFLKWGFIVVAVVLIILALAGA